MPDVTFGVKVSEEMKQELSELMKTTELTGKEFMSLLVHSYKLEKEKKKENVVASDLDELQRLLQRIQHLYMNINERTELIIQDKMKEKDMVIDEHQKAFSNLEVIMQNQQKAGDSLEDQIKQLEVSLKDKEMEIEKSKEELEEQKIQIKQQSKLEEKYEEKIQLLHNQLSQFERLELEIEERNAENNRLKIRNDELASEVWFVQREIEKLKSEHEMVLEKKEMEMRRVQESYGLETTNQLLEQKLLFNQKMDLLKEEHYKVQQQLNNKIQLLLVKNDENV